MERWKDINGYDGLYQVSDCGNVRNVKTGKNKKAGITPYGYKRVVLYANGKRKWFQVHRLVADAFIPNEDGKREVNHIDGNKLNNNAANLEWATSSENHLHAYSNGLKHANIENAVKARSKKVKCSNGVVYESVQATARSLGICASNISEVCNGKRKKAGGYCFEFAD